MIGVNCVRFIAQYNLLKKDVGNNYFYFWSTAIACMFTICFILFFLTFEIKNKNSKKIINYLGSETFYIYLLHYLTFNILDKYFGRENIVAFLD